MSLLSRMKAAAEHVQTKETKERSKSDRPSDPSFVTSSISFVRPILGFYENPVQAATDWAAGIRNQPEPCSSCRQMVPNPVLALDLAWCFSCAWASSEVRPLLERKR